MPTRFNGRETKISRRRAVAYSAVVPGMLGVALSATHAVAQEASPAAEAAPSALSSLGLQEIVITAQADTFSLSFVPPMVEGWALVTLVNESDVPANVNLALVPEGQSVGDLSSAVFQNFQGTGGELPDWFSSTDFAGGASAPAGGTTQSAVWLTPGKWATFSTNPMGVQPLQTFQVATPDELVNLYGIEPEATPVAGGATPVVEGLPSDGTLTINDGSYTADPAPAAGAQVWAVTNDSSQVSEFVLVSVDYEIPAEEAVLWAQTYAAGTLGNAVVQNASGLLSPGATDYVGLDLAPGTYVLFSTAPDTAGGIQSDNGLNMVFTVS